MFTAAERAFGFSKDEDGNTVADPGKLEDAAVTIRATEYVLKFMARHIGRESGPSRRAWRKSAARCARRLASMEVAYLMAKGQSA